MASLRHQLLTLQAEALILQQHQQQQVGFCFSIPPAFFCDLRRWESSVGCMRWIGEATRTVAEEWVRGVEFRLFVRS